MKIQVMEMSHLQGACGKGCGVPEKVKDVDETKFHKGKVI